MEYSNTLQGSGAIARLNCPKHLHGDLVWYWLRVKAVSGGVVDCLPLFDALRDTGKRRQAKISHSDVSVGAPTFRAGQSLHVIIWLVGSTFLQVSACRQGPAFCTNTPCCGFD
ncbi:MAG: hypothetical protein O9256_00910 [Rhizobiaceae bacterium]|nr:hypothetical protein [Rhizobiaceae bacterium]